MIVSLRNRSGKTVELRGTLPPIPHLLGAAVEKGAILAVQEAWKGPAGSPPRDAFPQLEIIEGAKHCTNPCGGQAPVRGSLQTVDQPIERPMDC